MNDRIAVVGLWHLGCSITASWLRLGRAVTAIDFDLPITEALRQGRAPVFEPGVEEALADGLARGTLTVQDTPSAVRGCAFVFIAYDTPVRDDETSDLAPIWTAVEACGPHLTADAIVVISAQLPVGSARRIRTKLKEFVPSVDLVYVPENLRLGEAIRCYLAPSHIVIGSESPEAAAKVEALFRPMRAQYFRMNLPSAEMVKHCINSFLASSITLANQWTDICGVTGADFFDVATALRADPRIGESAYLTPGVGFSGGTLGRDLRVLDDVSQNSLAGGAPIFGDIWRYNQRRVAVVGRRAIEILGGLEARRIGLLGMTYKPGTSTLRRSLPLAVATDLLERGAVVAAHDPKADWSEVTLPERLTIADSPYRVAESAELLVLLTEWPEYLELDFDRLCKSMRRPLVLDTKGFLRQCRNELAAAGLRFLELVPSANTETG